MHIARHAVVCALTLAVLAGLLLTGCAAAPPADGGIWLLGEVHDNPDGHRQRLAWLQARVAAGWRPAIAMEQFDREQQAALDAALGSCADAACVVQALAPAHSGWEWDYYRPVLQLAMQYRLPVVAANVSRADAGLAMRGGLAAVLDERTLAAFGADRPAPADLVASQRRDIVAGHCNMLPESSVGGMVNAQIARDVWMAKIVSEQAHRGVVLLAGNGHVRRDVGVGRWLQNAMPGVMHNLGFLETGADYPAAAFDEVQLIAPHQRADPCAGLQKHFAAPAGAAQ